MMHNLSSFSNHQQNVENLNQSHSRSNTVNTDKLQRRLQKLEQDVLSKNIQHDIMVNKEEMMTKRLKLSVVRMYIYLLCFLFIKNNYV